MPCRHLIALICKEQNLGWNTLQFQPRWEISYYQELNCDPDALQEEEEEKEGTDNNSGNIIEITMVIVFFSFKSLYILVEKN